VHGIPSQPPRIELPISMSPDMELVQQEDVDKEGSKAAAQASSAAKTDPTVEASPDALPR